MFSTLSPFSVPCTFTCTLCTPTLSVTVRRTSLSSLYHAEPLMLSSFAIPMTGGSVSVWVLPLRSTLYWLLTLPALSVTRDSVVSCFVCYETVFSVAAGCQCGGDVIAAHRYRLDTGKSICHLEGQCIVACIDCCDRRHGFVDAHGVDTGRLAAARAAVGKEVIVSLTFSFYGQCSVGQLLAISPEAGFSFGIFAGRS